jgi:hypothetical protein
MLSFVSLVQCHNIIIQCDTVVIGFGSLHLIRAGQENKKNYTWVQQKETP